MIDLILATAKLAAEAPPVCPCPVWRHKLQNTSTEQLAQLRFEAHERFEVR